MTKEEALQCATMLEAHPQAIMKTLAQAKNTQEAEKLLIEVKKNARKKLRILAKTLHPDITDDKEKHELLKKLNLVIQDLDNATLGNFISPPKPQRKVQFVIIQSYGGAASTSYSWSTATNSNNSWGWYYSPTVGKK